MTRTHTQETALMRTRIETFTQPDACESEGGIPIGHRMRLTTVGSAVLIAGLVLGVPAEANSGFANRTTHLELEYAVAVPEATLPAGHYVFEVDPSQDVVWIRNEDNGHVYGPYFTRVRRRLESTRERKILVERSGDGITILRGWFGRFQREGYELVYPPPSGD